MGNYSNESLTTRFLIWLPPELILSFLATEFIVLNWLLGLSIGNFVISVALTFVSAVAIKVARQIAMPPEVIRREKEEEGLSGWFC